MRKLAIISLLLSLSILIAEPLRAQQTRPRQVGQSTSTQSTRPAQNPARSQDDPEEVDEGDVIRVNTTLITVPVNVVDRDGKYVANLRQQDFRLYEEGVEQEIAYFASVDKPFTIALLLDTSDSTRFKLEEIQDAAIAFLDQLRPDDKVMVVTFNSKIEVLSEPTSDRSRLRDAIRRAKSSRGTFLYRAVDLTINRHLNQFEGRKAIVLFTDGIDSGSSRKAYDDNISDAEASNVLIYPIQYETSLVVKNNPRRIAKVEQANAYLHDAAEKTGARYFAADTPQNLSRAFAFIADELRRQYSLGFYPKTAVRQGQRRQLKVTVNRPNLIVRARDHYTSNASARAGVAQDNEQ